RQWRRGYRGTHSRPGRLRPYLVQAESAAAQGAVVAARQQQLRAIRSADGAVLLRAAWPALPRQLLAEVQALDRETAACGTRRLRTQRRRKKQGRSDALVARAAPATCRDQPRECAVHRRGGGQYGRYQRRQVQRQDIPVDRAAESRDGQTHLPRGKLDHPHGPAVFAHRRYLARSPVLVARRSAETSLRRYRLVVRRPVRRGCRARGRYLGVEGADDGSSG